MPDLLDFLSLYPGEDEASILQRMRDDANEGLDPEIDVDRWTDTREGTHWYICVMPNVREFARVWDLLGTEVPAAGMVAFAWGEYLDDHAEPLTIFRRPGTQASGEVTFTGPEGTVIAQGLTVTIDPPTPDAEVPEFAVVTGGTIDVSGEITLAVRATEYGVAGDVSAGAVTVFSTPPPDPAMTVVNRDAIRGGSEPESDESLRARVFAAYEGQGAGNKRDYERWSLAWPGVGRVTVIPLWNGPGTVKVIVTAEDGSPLSAEIVAGLQADLDPIPGMAEGEAPVSAIVTVETAAAVDVTIEARVETAIGYSLDGSAGTTAIEQEIEEEIRAYIATVPPGGEVVLAQVTGRIASVEGVHDVASVTINGSARNLAINDNPAQVPQLVTPLTLTEGPV